MVSNSTTGAKSGKSMRKYCIMREGNSQVLWGGISRRIESRARSCVRKVEG